MYQLGDTSYINYATMNGETHQFTAARCPECLAAPELVWINDKWEVRCTSPKCVDMVRQAVQDWNDKCAVRISELLKKQHERNTQ